jgi:type IV pilus assembly protein PilV
VEVKKRSALCATAALSNRRRSRGFSILEIVAAVLVIAVGIVGVAALYSDRVRTTEETTPQIQAAELAESIAKRIRENREGRAGYASAMGVICNGQTRRPQPQDIAAQEAACWEDEVEKRLPNGLGTIRRDLTTTPLTYVVAVSWSAPGQGAASYVVRVRAD